MGEPMSRDLFDFTDLELFATDVPHEGLARLRRETPVFWNPLHNTPIPGDGFWLISKYEDIVKIEKNPSLFSSHYGLTLADAPSATWGAPWSMVRDGLTHLDPPAHHSHRQIVAPLFTPRAVLALEPKIRDIAAQVVERARELHSVDFAREVALRFPVAVVLGALFGLPPDDFAKVIYWSDVVAAPRDPEFSKSAGVRVIHELYNYALSIFASRRRNPREDILSVLAHSKDADGRMMSEETFVRYFWSLVTGAFDTTASAISGGMLALILFPEEYAKLLSNPALVPGAVEEILRWETPTIYFRRTAMADTEVRGQHIGRGQRVLMCYASANRDEDVFTSAGNFDVNRRPNDHLSFGHGPHFCLGASLARTEIRILFEYIIQRRLRVELVGEIRRARSNFQNRIKYMPVHLSDM
jgi:cholest-4-en-3-one 26-monooxygenase